MGWESRGGSGPYYYRKMRRDGRIVSKYIGRGENADEVAALVAEARERCKAEAEERREEKRKEAEAEERLDGFVREAEAAAEARLTELGYHKHKRQWRRRRGRRND